MCSGFQKTGGIFLPCVNRLMFKIQPVLPPQTTEPPPPFLRNRERERSGNWGRGEHDGVNRRNRGKCEKPSLKSPPSPPPQKTQTVSTPLDLKRPQKSGKNILVKSPVCPATDLD